MTYRAFMCVAALMMFGEAHADMLSHQPEPTESLSQALHDNAVAAHHRGHSEQGLQFDEQNLRRLGLSERTAKDGLWAVVHRPRSQCAQYVRQLAADAKGASEAFVQSDQRVVVYLENSGICERENLR
ncbi:MULTISPECIES: hypothetical protein [Bombella]|uniref:Uncharacterized protein n=1 Tax=Bombella pollinis TaxID=2967337 RepID=A0ABT3WIC4_9PROT|nr:MULTISPECIES: hypothetical protein [Bombella]MCT6856120.1 hypothetical protein [Bombella apis]MCX5618816.1 hypothetical protein [Bombella pollinis]MUG04162.1 hypothetical protein [Bombella sp. ESL0378]MUG89659.1 hypothetical protein [Bombella sp. ESL0385]